MSRITRHFLPLPGGGQIHYRRAGSGPPLILMHPSPNSSALVVPMIEAMAKDFTCIAIDTPGYGISDDVVTEDTTHLHGYAVALEKILAALGIGACAIYGAATGAQIAVRFAIKNPDRVPLLILDSIGDFTDEMDHVLDGYFQDITPVRDGSHLMRAWDMCRHLSVAFPWHSTRGADRLDMDVAPPEAINKYVVDYLRAGPNYAKAYRPAVEVERWDITARVTVPTLLAHNKSSGVIKHVDALIAKGLPANFTVVACDGPTRIARLHDAAVGRRPNIPPPPPPPRQTSSADGFQNMTVAVTSHGRAGDIRLRVNLNGKGRPLIGIHDPAGSSALIEPFLSVFSGARPVIAIDLPGNGESDNIIDPANITTAAYAEVVNATVAALGLDAVDVFGRYSGGQVGMEMAFQTPNVVKHVIQSPFMIFEGEEQKWLLANYTPSIAPRWDGSHLITAWRFMYDQSLFWPWFDATRRGVIKNAPPIDVARTHLRVVELLKIGDQYRAAYTALWTYPMRARLPKLPVPTLIGASAWEPTAAKTPLAAEIAPGVATATLPDQIPAWRPIFDAFLGT